MTARRYKYRDLVERGIAALNSNDMDALLDAKDFSPNFTKHLGPPSMNWPSQTREQWGEDLTSGFVGEMYIEFHIELQVYWEDVENRSAIGWFSEKGLFVEDQKYEQTYVMRYEFDEDGKLLNIWELTDSYLQKTLIEKWVRRVAQREANKTLGDNKT